MVKNSIHVIENFLFQKIISVNPYPNNSVLRADSLHNRADRRLGRELTVKYDGIKAKNALETSELASLSNKSYETALLKSTQAIPIPEASLSSGFSSLDPLLALSSLRSDKPPKLITATTRYYTEA